MDNLEPDAFAIIRQGVLAFYKMLIPHQATSYCQGFGALGGGLKSDSPKTIPIVMADLFFY